MTESIIETFSGANIVLSTSEIQNQIGGPLFLRLSSFFNFLLDFFPVIIIIIVLGILYKFRFSLNIVGMKKKPDEVIEYEKFQKFRQKNNKRF